jgi:hypothetical protein
VLNNKRLFWLLSGLLLIGTIFAKVVYLNGSVLGLNYGLFHPDGMYYSFKTLTLLGNSQQEAGLSVSDFYKNHAVGSPLIAPDSLYFNSGSWEIYQLRLLYPILSVPFVALMGLWGMIVIPILSFVLLWVFATYRLKDNPFLASIVLIVLSSSWTISRWMFANISDALLVGIFTVYLILLPRILKSSITKFVLYHSIFIVLTSLTRFTLLLWVGIAIAFAIRRSFSRAASVLILAFLGFLPTLFVDFFGAITPDASGNSLLSKITSFPYILMRMHLVEIGQLFVMDRVFFLTMIILLVHLFLHIRTRDAQLVLLVASSLVLTASLNGVLGVNFRYHLPLLPFLINYLSVYSASLFRFKK